MGKGGEKCSRVCGLVVGRGENVAGMWTCSGRGGGGG